MLYPFDKSIKLTIGLNNMGYPKKHRAEEKWAQKKKSKKKIRKNNL